jgi:hypothetical protein
MLLAVLHGVDLLDSDLILWWFSRDMLKKISV